MQTLTIEKLFSFFFLSFKFILLWPRLCPLYVCKISLVKMTKEVRKLLLLIRFQILNFLLSLMRIRVDNELFGVRGFHRGHSIGFGNLLTTKRLTNNGKKASKL